MNDEWFPFPENSPTFPICQTSSSKWLQWNQKCHSNSATARHLPLHEQRQFRHCKVHFGHSGTHTRNAVASRLQKTKQGCRSARFADNSCIRKARSPAALALCTASSSKGVKERQHVKQRGGVFCRKLIAVHTKVHRRSFVSLAGLAA